MDEATAAPAETPQEAPEAPVSTSATQEPPEPVTPDTTTKLRSDNDALVGEFVNVVAGEHAGRGGAFEKVLSHDKATGFPKLVLVRTRDEFNQLLSVLYEHIRPNRSYKGGR